VELLLDVSFEAAAATMFQVEVWVVMPCNVAVGTNVSHAASIFKQDLKVVASTW
jgi:hypothetical protein